MSNDELVIRSVVIGDIVSLLTILKLRPTDVFQCRSSSCYRWSPLHLAVEARKLEVVEILLQWYPPILYVKDDIGWSPLVWAAFYCGTALQRFQHAKKVAAQGTGRSVGIAMAQEDYESYAAINWLLIRHLKKASMDINEIEQCIFICQEYENDEVKLAFQSCLSEQLQHKGILSSEEKTAKALHHIISSERGDSISQICLLYQCTPSMLYKMNPDVFPSTGARHFHPQEVLHALDGVKIMVSTAMQAVDHSSHHFPVSEGGGEDALYQLRRQREQREAGELQRIRLLEAERDRLEEEWKRRMYEEETGSRDPDRVAQLRVQYQIEKEREELQRKEWEREAREEREQYELEIRQCKEKQDQERFRQRQEPIYSPIDEDRQEGWKWRSDANFSEHQDEEAKDDASFSKRRALLMSPSSSVPRTTRPIYSPAVNGGTSPVQQKPANDASKQKRRKFTPSQRDTVSLSNSSSSLTLRDGKDSGRKRSQEIEDERKRRIAALEKQYNEAKRLGDDRKKAELQKELDRAKREEELRRKRISSSGKKNRFHNDNNTDEVYDASSSIPSDTYDGYDYDGLYGDSKVERTRREEQRRTRENVELKEREHQYKLKQAALEKQLNDARRAGDSRRENELHRLMEREKKNEELRKSREAERRGREKKRTEKEIERRKNFQFDEGTQEVEDEEGEGFLLRDFQDLDFDERKRMEEERERNIQRLRGEADHRKRLRSSKLDSERRIREEERERELQEARRFGDAQKEAELKRNFEMERQQDEKRYREEQEQYEKSEQERERLEQEKVERELRKKYRLSGQHDLIATEKTDLHRWKTRLDLSSRERQNRLTDELENAEEDFESRRRAQIQEQEYETQRTKEREKQEMEQRHFREIEEARRKKDRQLEERLNKKHREEVKAEEERWKREELRNQKEETLFHKELEEKRRQQEQRQKEEREMEAQRKKRENERQKQMEEAVHRGDETRLLEMKRRHEREKQEEGEEEKRLQDKWADAAKLLHENELVKLRQESQRRHQERLLDEASRRGNSRKKHTTEIIGYDDERGLRDKELKDALRKAKNEDERAKERIDAEARERRRQLEAEQKEEERKNRLIAERQRRADERDRLIAEAKRVGDEKREAELRLEAERAKREEDLIRKREADRERRKFQLEKIRDQQRAKSADKNEERRIKKERSAMRQSETLKLQKELEELRQAKRNSRQKLFAKDTLTRASSVDLAREHDAMERKRKATIDATKQKLEAQIEAEKRKKLEAQRRKELKQKEEEEAKNRAKAHTLALNQLRSEPISLETNWGQRPPTAENVKNDPDAKFQYELAREEERRVTKRLKLLEERRAAAEKASDSQALRDIAVEQKKEADRLRAQSAAARLHLIRNRNAEDDKKRLEKKEKQREELIAAAHQRLQKRRQEQEKINTLLVNTDDVGHSKPLDADGRQTQLLRPLTTISSHQGQKVMKATQRTRSASPYKTKNSSYDILTREQLVEKRNEYGKHLQQRKNHNYQYGDSDDDVLISFNPSYSSLINQRDNTSPLPTTSQQQVPPVSAPRSRVILVLPTLPVPSDERFMNSSANNRQATSRCDGGQYTQQKSHLGELISLLAGRVRSLKCLRGAQCSRDILIQAIESTSLTSREILTVYFCGNVEIISSDEVSGHSGDMSLFLGEGSCIRLSELNQLLSRPLDFPPSFVIIDGYISSSSSSPFAIEGNFAKGTTGAPFSALRQYVRSNLSMAILAQLFPRSPHEDLEETEGSVVPILQKVIFPLIKLPRAVLLKDVISDAASARRGGTYDPYAVFSFDGGVPAMDIF